ncbi:MAG: hypothetical protein P4M08_12880 [Oligoflexia bacterium]|nr:hypothetical protein [Oligoflexia bacterium]
MRRDPPDHIKAVLQRIEPRWIESSRLPAKKLLRLALTRDLARSLHTLHSQFLATGDELAARDAIEREKFLSERFNELGLDANDTAIAQIYAQAVAGPKGQKKDLIAVSPIDPKLSSKIDATKLTRADRRWEAAIAHEALQLDWNFWTLESWVNVDEVESWGEKLPECLWPQGIILFVESSAFEESRWRGKWYLVLNPKIKSPEKLPVEPPLAYSASENLEPPKWTRLG